MKKDVQFLPCILAVSLAFSNVGFAQPPESATALHATLTESARSGTFTFIVFHRDTGEGTRTLYQQTRDGIAAHAGKATIASARVDDPAERALVEEYGIARAPMPMTVVVAPNGAVTGLFPRAVTKEQISAAIVPPTMMRCMKELQDQKLVFVCLTRSDKVDVPQGVQAVRQYPQFKDRVSLVGMRLDDPAEARFYQQMKLNPDQVNGPHAVLIAPPGVLVGHYGAQATADQIAAAIHQAGKCCEDANCKHNSAPQTAQQKPAAR